MTVRLPKIARVVSLVQGLSKQNPLVLGLSGFFTRCCVESFEALQVKGIDHSLKTDEGLGVLAEL